MFTGNTIRLSEFAGVEGLAIVRDCAFAYVGKALTNLEARVVPCGKPIHIAEALETNGVVGIITTAGLAPSVPDHLGLAVADAPQAAAYGVHEQLCALPGLQWEDFPTCIDPKAIIQPGALIAERNVMIGQRTIIWAGAVICERSIIGADCSIGPGAVIGTDAFEVDIGRSPYRVLRQAGGVWLGDHVEVQAKCTIVRATFGGFTRLGAEVKLDCQVHLAHDCTVGPRTRIAACAEISGRVNIGSDVFLGPNCSISNGLTIGDGATITIGAVVVRDVEAGQRVTGHFALPHTSWLKFIKSIR